MRARDFADQIVGAKQSKLAADPGGASAGLLGVDETGKEDASEIAIAESVEGKLAAMDGCEQGAVVGKGTERTHPAAAPLSGLPQMLEQLFQRGRFIDAGESIQVALSCLARDFGRRCKSAMPRRIFRQAIPFTSQVVLKARLRRLSP